MPGVAGIVVVALLVRHIGVDGYGAYALAFVGANAVSMLAGGWINQAILRFLPGKRDIDRHFIMAIVQGGMIAAALAITGTIVVLMFSMPEHNARLPLVFIGAALSALLAFYAVGTSILQARGHAGAIAVAELIRTVAWLSAVAGLALANLLTALLAFCCLACAYAVSCCAVFMFIRHALATTETSVPAILSSGKHWLSQFLRYGWAMSFWLGLTVAMPFLDRLLIETFLGVTAMGTYAAVYDLVFRGAAVLLGPVIMTIHPITMNYVNRGDVAGAKKVVTLSFIVLLIAAAALVTVAGLSSDEIASMFRGNSRATSALFMLLAAAGSMWQLGLIAHKLLEAQRRTTSILSALTTAIFANIAANVLLIPRFGVNGAAIASLLAALLYILQTSLLSVDWRARQNIGSAP